LKFFGSYTITYDSTSLGDTIGGVSFNFTEDYLVTNELGESRLFQNIIAVQGIIYKFSCETMSAVSDLIKSDDKKALVFTNSDHTITVNNAQLLYPVSITTGTIQQNSFDLRFFAGIDSTITSSNPLFSIA
jgi:hypothetical protein